MLHLYLLRHAKSSWKDDSLHDHARPLSARGRQQLEAMALPLRDSGAFDAVIYASDAERARMTLGGLLDQPGIKSPAALHVVPELYTFEMEDLLTWLRQRDRREQRITLIGHDPALSELATWLLDASAPELPTGALLHLSLSAPSWRRLRPGVARVRAHILPRDASHALYTRKYKRGRPPETTVGVGTPGERLVETLGAQLHEVRALERGVLLGADPEFLHQYRVLLRRSRAIVELLADTLGKAHWKEPRRMLRRHARATSMLRDIDVLLSQVRRWGARSPRGRVARATGLEAYLEEQRRREHGALCKRICSRGYARDLRQWRRQLESGRLRASARELDDDGIQRELTRRIARHDRQLQRLSADAPDADFHRVRKMLKRIRYIVDLDATADTALIKDLKRRQALFGDFQDLHMEADMLRGFARHRGEAGIADSQGKQLETLIGELDTRKAGVRARILELEPVSTD